MGESRGGEGGVAEGPTTTIVSRLVDSYLREGFELDEIHIVHTTGTTYSVAWRIRGQNDYEEPFYVGVDQGIIDV